MSGQLSSPGRVDGTTDEVGRARALLALHEALGEGEQDLESLLEKAVQDAASLLGDAAALWVVDQHNAVSLRAYAHHPARSTVHMHPVTRGMRHYADGLIASVVASGEPLRATGAEVQELLPLMEPAYRDFFGIFGVSAIVVVPLVCRGRRIGAIGVSRDQGGRAFDDSELSFVEQVARVISLTVANAALLDEISSTLQRSEAQAHEDHLTGLLNRRGFLELLRCRLANPPLPSALVAVLDMDGFRLVNDGFGHATGDAVLASLGARLRTAVPPGTPLARLGGDAFALLVEADDDHAAAAVLEDAVRGCTGSLSVVGLSVPITVSVGTAVAEGRDAADVLLQADLAMHRAKRRAGSALSAYQPALDDPATRTLHDVLALRRSIHGGELVVHYQPVLDVGGGPPKVEALVRRMVGGLAMPPGSWLPLAARAGLMPDVTEEVMTQVVNQLAEWWGSGLEVECAVNVPAPVLAAPHVLEALLCRLDEAGLPRRALSVEVTESDLVNAQAKSALTHCADADIGVAIDDFGTGWSAFSYLLDLPLRTLKVDRCFVEGVDVDPRRAAVVRALVECAHELDLRVVAEGVETTAVADVVIDLGADALQGYLFGRPGPASSVEPSLRSGLVVARS